MPHPTSFLIYAHANLFWHRTDIVQKLIRLRLAYAGQLAQVLERIRARRLALKSANQRLVLNQYGMPVMRQTVSEWLRQVRELTGIDAEAFQSRDLRAKAGTDKEDAEGMAAAKDQLGHTTEKMTSHYVRHRLGKRVKPTK